MSGRMVVLALSLSLLTGCTTYGKIQKAKIVHVKCTDYGCSTMIQLEDGTRRSRAGTWGEVGDEFSAQAVNGTLDGETWR